MKNRERQRQNRKRKEEMLNVRNEYGNCDPTPYEAVKNIILENKRKRRRCQFTRIANGLMDGSISSGANCLSSNPSPGTY